MSSVRRTGIAWWWLVAVAASLIGFALWLRSTTVPWLAFTLLVTVLAFAAGGPARAGRLGMVGTGILTGSLVAAAVQQRALVLATTQWDRYAREVAAAGVTDLSRAVAREVSALRDAARRAVEVPDDAPAAFSRLERLLEGAPPYRGVVVERRGIPVAWGGDLRSTIDSMPGDLGVLQTSFYTMLYAAETRGDARAVATALLHAEPPASRLTQPLDGAISGASDLRGFMYRPPEQVDSTWSVISAEGQQLLAVRPIQLDPGEAELHLVERARLLGATGMIAAVLVLAGLAWRRPATLVRRFLALLVLLIVVALVPLNAFSNASVVFDPAVYFAPLDGPFTGNVAALALTSAIVLLAFFALMRARLRTSARWPAVLGVLLVASLGPFLLRDLARGIALPLRGASTTLWLSWQLGLFLAAAATLLAGASAGRVALGTARGLPPAIAPALAGVAALIGPLLWQAPGRWPQWYTLLWIVAMAALALSRRTRALVLAVGIVAACGATTLVWGEVSRRRVALAQADAARLTQPDSVSIQLVDLLADDLEAGPPPVERSELLLRYVQSPLAAAGNPVEIASWRPGETRPHAELVIADFERRPEGEGALVREARATGERVWLTAPSSQGVQIVVAVPHRDSAVTTVVVAPRTLLIPEDPFTLLLGLAPPTSVDVPYEATVTTLPATTPVTTEPRWVRKANELHGDWRVQGASDSTRVHVEVDLRGLDALLPRGVLIVLLDLVVLGLLWTLAAAGDGALPRWWRRRVRHWVGSYRSRLTVTLFAFFVIPAAVFALWSYRRLLQTDRESRVLLVRETLRTVTREEERRGDLVVLGSRFDTPLFEYRGGLLADASDPLYLMLAPVGRYLPPDVAITLGVESEVLATARPAVAGTPVLFGYRAEALAHGRRVVLAAPARLNERALDRERRDIGILVLFVTSLGAIAALVLSGLAARELERPVGTLRRAALRIARGEQAPPLDAPPAREFVPVFSAFERMDADLRASRAALEEAQRRTEAVLRNVASGVVALDRHGSVTIANPVAEGMLGHAVTPGKPLADLGAPDLHHRTVAFLSHDLDEESFDAVIGDRQLRAILTRLTRGAGGAVLTLDDVTDLVRAQRVLAWGEMARQVAHEIKNPLTPIRLGVQHLRRARGDARVDFDRVFEQNVTRILEEIDRLDEIARAFSRYGMAPTERAPAVPVDVAAIVRDVVELERIGESEVAWRAMGTEEPVRAMANDPELREVLLNLLENARQAKARQVTVAVARRDGRVDLSVTDDGDGIPEDVLARIFEPHFSTRTSGSGLGLAISRGLVASWGGEMHVQSDRGRGTELRITLAAAPPE